MHVIRLKKVALKNNLSYSLVVITATKAAKSNQFIEKLGHYKPLVDKLRNKYTFVDLTRFFFWIKRGAFVHRSVYFLIKGLIMYSNTIKWKASVLPDILWISGFILVNNLY